MLTNIKISDIDTSGNSNNQDLPENLVNRIKMFKGKLVEVEKIPLEKTINNFKQDQNPEREICMWETIADVYSAYVASRPDLSLADKLEVYKVSLMASSAPLQQYFAKELASLKYVTLAVALDLENAVNSLLKLRIGKSSNPITVTSYPAVG